VYDRTAGTVSLGYEDPNNGANHLVPGSNSIISNNQCTLYGANTTVVIGTTSLVVTVDLTFNASWFGPKNMYLLAGEIGVNSGWVTVGTWTVTGGAPTANSVSPASGSGNSPNFTFTVSDSSTQSNIVGMSMLITAGAPTAQANACYLSYNRTNSTIGLYDDGGTTVTTKGIGSSTTLQNTQCAVGYGDDDIGELCRVHHQRSIPNLQRSQDRISAGQRAQYQLRLGTARHMDSAVSKPGPSCTMDT
jgi:hypothetical protein